MLVGQEAALGEVDGGAGLGGVASGDGKHRRGDIDAVGLRSATGGLDRQPARPRAHVEDHVAAADGQGLEGPLVVGPDIPEPRVVLVVLRGHVGVVEVRPDRRPLVPLPCRRVHDLPFPQS